MRRRCSTWRYAIVAIALAAVANLVCAAQPVVVVTSYAQEVISRVEDAFARAHPGARLQVIWRMPRDAMPYLTSEAGKDVDVYWSASGRNFADLAQRELFVPIPDAVANVPAKAGGFVLSDAQSRYVATEMATYGFAVNPAYLQHRALSAPQTWRELAAPRYAGHLLFPVPSKVGFAPLMIEALLQRYGWQDGWALLSEIAANAQLWTPGGAFITEEVANGKKGVAVTIDFFAQSAIANGGPMHFVHPDVIGISPGHAGVLRNAPNPDGARAFVDFLLSADGQKLLAHPDIRKLPVVPAVYASLPPGQFDPYMAARRNGFEFDESKAQQRMSVDNVVFDVLITQQGERHAKLWTLIREAEAKGESADGDTLRAAAQAARTRALRAPIDETQSMSSDVWAALGARVVRGGTDAPPQASAMQEAWRNDVAARYDQGIATLAAALASTERAPAAQAR